jgi:serine phosphatase RsbU (regulator of sigma subunit)
VLTDDDRVIGLPRQERYADPEARTAALLKRPAELGIDVVGDAVRALTDPPADDRGPLRFRSDGQPWWGEVRTFALAPERVLTVAVVVPESDFLGSLRRIRLGIVLVTLGVLAIALLQALFLARRYSRPIEALVGESDRISQGYLERGAMVVSSVAEVQHLARAHDRMRLALQSLFKMERDLQLARQIQRSTWPDDLPRLRGFDIAAWSEPTEETGGDTYDVIGLDTSPDGVVIVPAGPAPRAMLLLADAAGHGFGAALSVVQVRAMLRMAVRAGEDLPVIVQRVNAQLAADLTEGRFVTAWFGLLDARDHTLTSLACGQAPIIRYVASRQTCEALDADTVPLGIFDSIETDGGAQRLDPEDVLAVCSDGIFEARGPAREQFGPERVVEVIRAHHTASAAEMLDALRKGVDAFTRGAPADDDRTAIIIKRTP